MAQNTMRNCHKAWNMIWMGVTGVIVPTSGVGWVIQDAKHMFSSIHPKFLTIIFETGRSLYFIPGVYICWVIHRELSEFGSRWSSAVENLVRVLSCYHFTASTVVCPSRRDRLRPLISLVCDIYTYNSIIVSMMRICALHLICHNFF